MRIEDRQRLVWMAVFFIAMAYLESAVVVYLRALVCPAGFAFPNKGLDAPLIATEAGREAATLVMLWAPAALVTRSALERFAWFCFGFGVWDIFYYIWLKVLLNWPMSLTDPDLLFLLPMPWVGPVWAPCFVSLGLIALAFLIFNGRARDPQFKLKLKEWACLLLAATLIVISFTWLPLQGAFGLDALSASDPMANPWLDALVTGGTPASGLFSWPWFLAGCVLALWAMALVFRRVSLAMNHASVDKL